nr:MAG TPA: hypothetical protein [Caudoviricetes sp.]
MRPLLAHHLFVIFYESFPCDIHLRCSEFTKFYILMFP